MGFYSEDDEVDDLRANDDMGYLASDFYPRLSAHYKGRVKPSSQYENFGYLPYWKERPCSPYAVTPTELLTEHGKKQRVLKERLCHKD